jgi:hypothetical protein
MVCPLLCPSKASVVHQLRCPHVTVETFNLSLDIEELLSRAIEGCQIIRNSLLEAQGPSFAEYCASTQGHPMGPKVPVCSKADKAPSL